ncbi:hypothetical protein [Nannocystis exedens]|uniref:hypothetical protein n=1 Tax=Nannocystis exedens TaxID=54 RepID=UPI0011606136|nr:hypothetical protein [Nannocystis exedens]
MGRAIEAIGAWRPAMTASMRRVDTADGFERAFGLQYLARYALERGRASAGGRLLEHRAVRARRLGARTSAEAPRRRAEGSGHSP